MKQLSHSKYRNTGLIFELLVHQISIDTLNNQDSPAVDIIKKYFIKTELGKEYKIYESLIKSPKLSEGKATILLDTLLESSKKLNKKILKSLKYNIIKEISEHYNINEFFTYKVKPYKELASIYNLLETVSSPDIFDFNQVLSNKNTLLEYLIDDKQIIKETNIEEFESYDKDLRILTYKILLEKFNQKYNKFSSLQKSILKEFILSPNSPTQLKNFYNGKVKEFSNIILEENKKIKDNIIKIKLDETLKYLTEIDKHEKINDEHLIDLLQYSELISEIKNINGKI